MYPLERKRSLHKTIAMPAISPMATRPAAPIQLLSKANFRKYETPTSTAVMPIRFSHCEPMRDSRSRSGGDGLQSGAGGRGGICGRAGERRERRVFRDCANGTGGDATEPDCRKAREMRSTGFECSFKFINAAGKVRDESTQRLKIATFGSKGLLV